MDGKDHQLLREFEWMQSRVGEAVAGSRGEATGKAVASLQAELEALRSECERLRTTGSETAGGQDRREGRSGRTARTPTLAEVERDHILKVLLDCHWRVKGPDAAAELLGLNPGTLYSRMKKLGIRRDDS